ncbi:MAG: transglycosylase SLT domain-containing protein [Pseudomonadota bacterium]
MIRPSLFRLAVLWVACAAFLVSSGHLARAQTDRAEGEACLRWAAVAAAEFGVPEPLMSAITRVETARDDAPAWPWAMNAEGQGYWFSSAGDAAAHAKRAVARGVEQVDLGCFQLNVKWHGAAFSSLDQMLDPAYNARYAARFLAHLHSEFGNWTEAAAAFHSRTPDLGHAYLRRLKAALQEKPPTFAEDPLRQAGGVRAPRPLLAEIAPLRGLPGGRSEKGGRSDATTDGRGGLLYVRR